MSRWQERVKQLQVWARLDDVRSLVAQEIGAATSTEVMGDLERLAVGESFVRRTLGSIDPVLLVPEMLTGIEDALSRIQSEMNAYTSNKNPQHLIQANLHLDRTLVGLAAIPPPIAGSAEGGAILSITEVRSAAESAITALSRTREKLASDLSQLQGQADTLAPTINEQKTRLDTAISTHQSQFAEAQSDRAKEFEGQRKQLSDKGTEVEEELKDHAEIVLLAMAGMRDQAQTLLHIIGNTGMSGEYAKTANSSRIVAMVWQGVTAVSLVLLVVFAVHAYSGIAGSTVDIAHTVGRVFVMATLGILAAYASRQADHYQKSEERNRRYQLVLSSIDPYLASLEEKERSPVKIELAKVLFGQADATSISPAENQFAGSASDVLKLLTQLFEAARGK